MALAAACSSGRSATAGASSPHVGIPGDTASPAPTATAPVAGSGTPATVPGETTPPEVTPTDLAGCLAGTWRAPVGREFAALGIERRSGGLVRSGAGDVRLDLARDGRFTLAYEQVALTLPAGRATVGGTVAGTWSLDADVLRTTVTSNATSARAEVAGVTIDNRALTGALASVPPSGVHVTCTDRHLRFPVDGSSITSPEVTFDRG